MNLRNAGLIAFGIATIPLTVAIYSIHHDLAGTPPGLTARGHEEGKPTLGDERFELLVRLTRAYVAHHADAPAGMRAGAELAPLAFLNHELEVEGVKWRVREVHGLVADTYNVS